MPATIDYRSPPEPGRLPHPLPAVLLTLPGLICWLGLSGMLAAILLPRQFMTSVAAISQNELALSGDVVIFCWVLAIICAVLSLSCYGGRRARPWYVKLNLLVNVWGLAFSAVALPALVIILIFRD